MRYFSLLPFTRSEYRCTQSLTYWLVLLLLVVTVVRCLLHLDLLHFINKFEACSLLACACMILLVLCPKTLWWTTGMNIHTCVAETAFHDFEFELTPLWFCSMSDIQDGSTLSVGDIVQCAIVPLVGTNKISAVCIRRLADKYVVSSE